MTKGIKGFSQAKVGSNNRKSYLGDIEPFNFNEHDKEKIRVRLIGPVMGVGTHWLPIKTKSGKETKIPKLCLNYNADEDSFEDNGCPYCEVDKSSRKYLVNAIIRSEQDSEPKKVPEHTKSERKIRLMCEYECHVKEPGSKSWTPVKTLMLPGGVAYELKDLCANNTDKKGRTHDLSDPKYGMDITIRFNSEKAGESKYRIDTVERTPLTDEELEYLLPDLESIPVETSKEAKEEYKKLESMLDVEDLEEDNDDELDVDDEDEDEKPSKKSKKGKKVDVDEEDDEDDEDESRKKNKKSKRSKYDDDDDEDDLDDLDSEDDDDEPVKKKSKKAKKNKKSKKNYDDDEDDLDDLD